MTRNMDKNISIIHRHIHGSQGVDRAGHKSCYRCTHYKYPGSSGFINTHKVCNTSLTVVEKGQCTLGIRRGSDYHEF